MKAFEYIPAQVAASSVVFASPHSGRDYPADLLRLSCLPEAQLRSSEDAFVDLFLGAAPAAGAPVLLGMVPRAFVDFNRAASELDPALIADIPRHNQNPRVLSGLGVIPRVVAGGRAIYSGKITRAEAEHRVNAYWRPYHAKLGGILENHRQRFGRAILFDMHSMPRESASPSGSGPRADIVLGDRFGAAAHGDIIARVAAIFTAAGLRVARNAPFAGAYIAQKYGLPSIGQHVIQVEIDRSLYMDEARVVPNADFAAFQALMDRVVPQLAAIGRDTASLGLAAE